MGFFDFGRIEGFPTQYAEKKTPVTEDVLEAGFIAAFTIIIVASFTILAGFRLQNGVSFLTRIVVSAAIGLTIMLGNFGQYWEVGHIRSKTPYKAGTAHEIQADIGINIGLRSVNITLKASTQNEQNELKGEIINYNERFEWTWDQGRFGFGPQAGLLQREFRTAQRRGLPLPILWIVDYLVVDGEGLRFGRFYRTAGWYAHIAIWSALPCWMLANLLFLSVANYGAIFLALSGSFQILACLLWASIRNSIELVVPFEDGEIKTHFGMSFWLTFVGGLLSLLVSIAVICVNLRFPNEISVFFGINTLYDLKILAESDVKEITSPSDDQEMALLRPKKDEKRTVVIRERRSLLPLAQKDLQTKHEVPKTSVSPISGFSKPKINIIKENSELTSPESSSNERRVADVPPLPTSARPDYSSVSPFFPDKKKPISTSDNQPQEIEETDPIYGIGE